MIFSVDHFSKGATQYINGKSYVTERALDLESRDSSSSLFLLFSRFFDRYYVIILQVSVVSSVRLL